MSRSHMMEGDRDTPGTLHWVVRGGWQAAHAGRHWARTVPSSTACSGLQLATSLCPAMPAPSNACHSAVLWPLGHTL